MHSIKNVPRQKIYLSTQKKLIHFMQYTVNRYINKRRLNLSIFYVVAVTIKYNNNKYPEESYHN